MAVPTAEQLAAEDAERCALCGVEIEPHQPRKTPTAALGVCHATCTDEYYEVYPEHDPEKAATDAR